MALDPQAQFTVFISSSSGLTFRSMLDGEVVAQVPLGHSLFTGASMGSVIATIGYKPDSVIVINDRHEHHQQQHVDIPFMPLAVAISPAQDTIAVMLANGMMCLASFLVCIDV